MGRPPSSSPRGRPPASLHLASISPPSSVSLSSPVSPSSCLHLPSRLHLICLSTSFATAVSPLPAFRLHLTSISLPARIHLKSVSNPSRISISRPPPSTDGAPASL